MAVPRDKQSIKTFLGETVALLCKNVLRFESEFSIEGLIGITLDRKDVFLVSINETVKLPEVDKVLNSKTTDIGLNFSKNTAEHDETLQARVVLHSAANDRSPEVNATADTVRASVADDSQTLQSSAMMKIEVSEAMSASEDGFLTDSERSRRILSSGAEEAEAEMILPIDRESLGGHETMYSASNIPDILKKVACPAESPSGKKDDDGNYFENSFCHLDPKNTSSSSYFVDLSRDLEAGRSMGSSLDIIEIKEEDMTDDESSAPSHPSSSTPSHPSSSAPSHPSSLHQQVAVFPSEELGSLSSGINGVASEMNSSLGVGCSYWEKDNVNSMPSSCQLMPNESQFTRGQKAKKRKFYECTKCGSILSTVYSLRKHEAIIHQGNYQFTCHLCGKGLRTEYNLRGHMASRHNMKKDYRCPICAREFGYRHTLRDHVVSCHGMSLGASQMTS